MTNRIAADGIDGLLECRSTFLANGCDGVDPDHDGMCEALGDEALGLDDEALEGRWFDACIDRYRRMFATGRATLYRAVSTSDAHGLMQAIAGGTHPGDCWTWDDTCATTSLHPGERGTHDVRIVAEATRDVVCWAETLRCNFSRPWEREIRVRGPVSIVNAMAVPLP